METEYKFRISDESVFQDMLRLDRLAGVSLGPMRRVAVNDRYLDTASGTLLQHGYSCRLRESATGDRLITIKSLTVSADALHVREELETRLPSGIPVEDARQWPESLARDLVENLLHDDRLEELFAINQERYQRLLPAEASPEVELSFDRVSLGGPDAPVLYWLEAELLADGRTSLLDQVVDDMRRHWSLIPESRAKFWWALAAMRPDLVPESE